MEEREKKKSGERENEQMGGRGESEEDDKICSFPCRLFFLFCSLLPVAVYECQVVQSPSEEGSVRQSVSGGCSSCWNTPGKMGQTNVFDGSIDYDRSLSFARTKCSTKTEGADVASMVFQTMIPMRVICSCMVCREAES